MADFPTEKTNAVDYTTDVLAKHINNLENKVGIDGSADSSSLDYKINTLETAQPTGAIVGTTDTQTLSGKTLTTPKIDTISEETSDAGVTIDGVKMKDNNLIMTSLTMNDDTATSFTPSGAFGYIIVGNSTNSGHYFIGSFRAAATAWMNSAVASALFVTTTGALTGTTGTDAKFTVSAGTDGKIYLENRLGGQKGIYYIVFAT